jgi:TM2 domain-containing membrane protein YozV
VIDSKKHGKNPVLWGILGFVFGAIALGIYLIRTDRKVTGWIVTILSIIGYLALILIVGLAIFFTVVGFS